MYDKFPLTLAALEELELESSGGQCPSCSACWAVGDALLKERVKERRGYCPRSDLFPREVRRHPLHVAFFHCTYPLHGDRI